MLLKRQAVVFQWSCLAPLLCHSHHEPLSGQHRAELQAEGLQQRGAEAEHGQYLAPGPWSRSSPGLEPVQGNLMLHEEGWTGLDKATTQAPTAALSALPSSS